MFTLVLVKDHVRIDPNTFYIFDQPPEHLYINRFELKDHDASSDSTKDGAANHNQRSVVARSAVLPRDTVAELVERDVQVERTELAHDERLRLARGTETFEHAVRNWLHSKYSGGVLPDVGLCICVYSIDEIGSTHIYPLDGAIHCHVVFRLVVFRPVLGEVLVGSVLRCDRKLGIRVHMNFFRDVWIPPHLLQEHSEFDDDEGVWVWHFGEHELPMEVGELIRFRVHSILFDTHQSSAPPFMGKEEQQAAAMAKAAALSMRNQEGAEDAEHGDGDEGDDDDDSDVDESDRLRNAIEREQNMLVGERSRAPFEIIGRVNEDGLGMLEWWTGPSEDEGEGEEQEEQQQDHMMDVNSNDTT